MPDPLHMTLRFIMWPFFRLIGVLVLLLVGVSVYTLYSHVQGPASAGFFTTPSVNSQTFEPDAFALSASQGTLSGAIRLNWKSIPNTIEYRVYRLNDSRGKSCGTGTMVLRIAAEKAPVFTETAPPGEVRLYQVQAQSAGGTASCSAPVQGFAG